MRRLYLHVGNPKAASTSIQLFLFRNFAKLAAKGYHVLDRNLQSGKSGGNPLWLIEELLRDPDGEAKVTRLLDEAKGDTLVASAENLANPKAAGLFASAAKSFDIKALFIIRRQDDWIYSAWKQWQSKTGKSLEQYVELALMEGSPDYMKSLTVWRDVCSRGVQVVCLDALPKPLEDVCLDWLDIPAAQGADLQKKFPSQNESFDFSILDILARHKGVYSDPHDRRIEEFIAPRSKLATKRKFRLSDELSKKVMESFYDENVALLGKEATDRMMAVDRSKRLVANSGEDVPGQHDYAIACLFEALGELSAEVANLRGRLKKFENAE